LGKENSTDWSRQIIYNIINQRYERLKPVIITTNLSVQELNRRVGEATVSRLLEMCQGIKLNGSDYRIELHRQLNCSNN